MTHVGLLFSPKSPAQPKGAHVTRKCVSESSETQKKIKENTVLPVSTGLIISALIISILFKMLSKLILILNIFHWNKLTMRIVSPSIIGHFEGTTTIGNQSRYAIYSVDIQPCNDTLSQTSVSYNRLATCGGGMIVYYIDTYLSFMVLIALIFCC